MGYPRNPATVIEERRRKHEAIGNARRLRVTQPSRGYDTRVKFTDLPADPVAASRERHRSWTARNRQHTRDRANAWRANHADLVAARQRAARAAKKIVTRWCDVQTFIAGVNHGKV